jgi:Ribosome inactivating protein
MTQGAQGLVRLDLSYGDTTLQLWFTANNLYLRGFTDTNGNTYGFSDFNLQNYMRYTVSPASQPNANAGLLPAAATGGAYITLPFASDYNDMVQAAQRGRDTMPISYNDLWGSWTNLANAGGAVDSQAFARSLMFMIQFTSESARFNDVYGVMADIMGNFGREYNGLPAVQQELENNWSQISQYAINLRNGTTPAPLYVGPNAGTLYWMGDVQARLAEGMGRPFDVSPTGDWWLSQQ